MAHPLLYEVNSRQWLAHLSQKHAKKIDLSNVPEEELNFLKKNGFTHLWLMGVWPTGPKSRAQALTHPDLLNAYSEALPGWSEDDIQGSPYAIADLQVCQRIGGEKGLAAFRAQLSQRHIKLILDFIPNHLGLDHPWVESHPHRFVSQPHPFPDSFPVQTSNGKRHLAHGKDPYFPGWTDTVQLEYRRPETRRAMTDLLRSIASKCDGVRCDMAMLPLSEVFHKTWNHIPADFETAPGEFWDAAIAEVRSAHPGFLFLAEAYWGLEGKLCELGFDYAYDKTLYDRVVHDHHWEIQPHVLGMNEQNHNRAHFLENHDEPRIAASVTFQQHAAAALLALGLPGMRFLHDGQLEGLRRFARVQLGRRAAEPTDEEVRRFYRALLPAFAQSALSKGDAQILSPRRAWDDNPTSQCFVVVQWQEAGRENHFDLVVVNLAPHRSQCRVELTAQGLKKGRWHMADRIGKERWVRDGADLAANGLYLDVEERGHRLFAFTRE